VGPEHASSFPDRESGKLRRGRPPVDPAVVLAAADKLFAGAASPDAVTTEAIAAAAGVGKGTVFRAFGSRDGLLDALAGAKFAPVREAVEGREPPLGSSAPSRDRVVAFLDALLTFKLENPHLLHAREVGSSGALRSERYRWMQRVLAELVADAVPAVAADDADYTAHALLAALHIDLVDELLAAGRSPDAIRRSQGALVRAVLDGAAG
jgi:AcrR family transcriptional regulator